MKIGIFVGSFNPVHKGHIKMVKDVLRKNIVDKVIIVPGRNYWDKNNLIDIKHRINMLEFYANENIIINKDLNDLPYTYLIMRELQKRYKKDELFLILGADNIVNFDKWMNYEELLNYGFIIFNRNNINVKYYLNKLNKTKKVIILSFKGLYSSTSIRNNINNLEYLKKIADIKIINYIKENKLYIGD